MKSELWRNYGGIMAVIFLIQGCATTCPPQLPPRIIQVPCVDQLPTKPKLHTDAEIKAMPEYDAVIALLMDRIDSAVYVEQLEAVLEGCI
jgi:hypothetical protein